MKRTLIALLAVFALTFGAQGAFAADDCPDAPGNSPCHKTHGDQDDHEKPGKGKGKGLGHCKHDSGGCDDNGGGGNGGDDDDDDNGDENGDENGDGAGDSSSSSNDGTLASTGV